MDADKVRAGKTRFPARYQSWSMAESLLGEVRLLLLLTLYLQQARPQIKTVEQYIEQQQYKRCNQRPDERQPPVGPLRFRRQKGHQPEKSNHFTTRENERTPQHSSAAVGGSLYPALPLLRIATLLTVPTV